MNNLWTIAVPNTSTKLVDGKYWKETQCSCKACGSTEGKHTRERQILGNCHQVIIKCKCGKHFVQDEY